MKFTMLVKGIHLQIIVICFCYENIICTHHVFEAILTPTISLKVCFIQRNGNPEKSDAAIVITGS